MASLDCAVVNSLGGGLCATLSAMPVRRDTFTARLPCGDFLLSPTGLTWGVRRANDNGSVADAFAGAPDRRRALATLLSLADGAGADAWEAAAGGTFRLLKRNRVSA